MQPRSFRCVSLSLPQVWGTPLPSLPYPSSLQKDLDALDEEDLYATLMEPLHSTMEVDHWAVFSEETLRKGGEKEEKMEVEEKEITPTPNIWQWMEKSEEQQTNQLSNHQVRRGVVERERERD